MAEEKEKNGEFSIQLFSNSLGDEELKEVKRVFESKWIGPGNETSMFEKELGEKIGCQRTLATDSCTSALFIALKTLDICDDDEVIIPSVHFIGTANAIIEVGAKPVFADVDLKTLNLIPSEIERLRTDKTKAVCLLHYGGHPCDMDKIIKICNKYNLKIIEDSANSPFSKYRGTYCGTLGDIGCVSFDAMKILAIGLGGAMFLKNDDLYEKAKEIRYFGLPNKKQSGTDSFKEGKTKRWWELSLSRISRKYVSSDVLSAIGRVQLRKVDEFIKRRKDIWNKYQKELSNIDWLEIPPEPLPNTESSYYLYWISIKNGKRDELAEYLVKNGVYCSYRYYPLHFIEKYNSKANLPNSEKANETVLNIPLHQNLSDENVETIINLIKNFSNEIQKDKKFLVDLIRVPDPSCIDDMLDEPLGLLYLGAVLKQNGYDVRITNLAGYSGDNWKSEIKEADMYGIQLYTPTGHIGVDIAKFIKEKFLGKPVICGGAHPTAVPNDPALDVFDNITLGEGERTIVKIANAYKNKEKIPRIIKSEFIEDLDSIPFPARELVDMMAFHRKVEGERCLGIIGSRGCCYQCTFCDRSLFGSRVRFRSIDNVVSEIKEIINKYGVKNFEFFDDMFTVNKKRLKEFAEKTKGLGIRYRCNGRADVLDKEVYELLRESGCRMICFGIESGSQKILNLMKKGTTVEQNMSAIKMAQEAGVPAMGYFIAGFPGETKETIQESIEFIKKSDIDQAQFYSFIPLPGCEVANNPERYGIKRMSKEYGKYFHVTGTDGHGGKVIDTQWLSADELQEEVKKIREFLRNHKWRGEMQDYYKKLGYKSVE